AVRSRPVDRRQVDAVAARRRFAGRLAAFFAGVSLAALGAMLRAAPAPARPGAPATFFIVSAAASNDCFIMPPASALAASVALSFIALVASSANWLVSALHHCIGSTAAAGAFAAWGLAAPADGACAAASASALRGAGLIFKEAPSAPICTF